jgi:hypothetical protein
MELQIAAERGTRRNPGATGGWRYAVAEAPRGGGMRFKPGAVAADAPRTSLRTRARVCPAWSPCPTRPLLSPRTAMS